jgi:uncharacterized protein
MRNFILLVVLFFATQWLLKKLRRANERTRAEARPAGNGSARTRQGAGTRTSSGDTASAPPQLPDPLVRCVQCGVHMPRSEAVVAAGQPFCCADHAHRYAARPTGRTAR